MLEVYDLSGQQVRRLMDHYQDGGCYRVSWDGLDEAGKPLSSGVYLMRLQAFGASSSGLRGRGNLLALEASRR